MLRGEEGGCRTEQGTRQVLKKEMGGRSQDRVVRDLGTRAGGPEEIDAGETYRRDLRHRQKRGKKIRLPGTQKGGEKN